MRSAYFGGQDQPGPGSLPEGTALGTGTPTTRRCFSASAAGSPPMGCATASKCVLGDGRAGSGARFTRTGSGTPTPTTSCWPVGGGAISRGSWGGVPTRCSNGYGASAADHRAMQAAKRLRRGIGYGARGHPSGRRRYRGCWCAVRAASERSPGTSPTSTTKAVGSPGTAPVIPRRCCRRGTSWTDW